VEKPVETVNNLLYNLAYGPEVEKGNGRKQNISTENGKMQGEMMEKSQHYPANIISCLTRKTHCATIIK